MEQNKSRPKIMIVDDSIVNIKILSYNLKDDYDIVTANNGQEALSLIDQGQMPDLILLDVIMPELDGYEVCRILKRNESTANVPIIFITGMDKEQDETKGLEVGAVDYITKPFSIPVVRQRVRTHIQLKQMKDALEKERNELKKRNDIIELDLDMARRIQLQFIPIKSPSDWIAFYYKPMEKVGGDFFDFIRFKDCDKLGIFLSDVSGHGVPAAFVTSMIKSALVQMTHSIIKPSQLLYNLNQMLWNLIGDNFVTAFFGIYDPTEQSIIFANAGHNPPYVIVNGQMSAFQFKSNGIPLGILDNNELKAANKLYIDEHIRFETGTRILFYTDGIIEAVNIQDLERNLHVNDFGTSALYRAVAELKDKPPKQFVEGIISHLVRFRGSKSFDDDICLICLDVR